MAKAYFTIKDIPKRGVDEGPATKSQLAQLRSLAPFKEADLANLGQWQVAYLIDQAEEIRNQIRAGPPKPKWGVTRFALILVIGVATAGVVKRLMDHSAATARQASSKLQDATAKAPASGNPADPFAQLHSDTAKNPSPAHAPPDTKPTPPTAGTVTTLDGVALPIYVISTARVDLLNEAGKEVPIPAGSTIRIEKRGAKGSLTMHIKGATFVGNEMRILGKVRLR